ncbi:MAG: hypothetical protein FJ125_00035 [Deltaproteobacteria bacterium]|nr:hypothetical protein [Deltaproteobacteria bacterium]
MQLTLLLAIAILLAGHPGAAHGALGAGAWRQTRFSQTYRLAPTWNTEFCPERPTDRHQTRSREFQLSEAGEHYSFRSGRESFGSHDCLSENPAVKLQSFDPATRTTRCATPESLGTHEIEGHRLIQHADDVLVLRGEYHYFWKLKGHLCEAWMIEERRFERQQAAEPLRAEQTPEPVSPPPQAPEARSPPETAPPATPPEGGTTRPAREQVPSSGAAARPRIREHRLTFEVLLDEQEERPAGVQRGGAAIQRRLSGSAEAPVGGSRNVLLLTLGGGVALVLLAVVLLAVRLLRRQQTRPPDPLPERDGSEVVFFEPGLPSSVAGETGQPASPEREAPAAATAATAATAAPATAVAAAPPPPATAVAATLPSPAAAATSPSARDKVTCPRCGAQLPGDARFCPFDATPLAGPAAAGNEPLAIVRICPTCQQQFSAPLEACPADGSPLLPVLYESATAAPRPERKAHKVCPSCDARYAPEVSFCGRDGTPLVLKS